MTVDDSRQQMWEEMQRQRQRASAIEPDPELPLKGGGGGDNSGGMEARLAKLEASMDYVKADLGRLSGVPAELARISERINHIPTRAEVQADINAAIDRSGTRVQRSVAIVGSLVAIAIAAITYLPKLLGH